MTKFLKSSDGFLLREKVLDLIISSSYQDQEVTEKRSFLLCVDTFMCPYNEVKESEKTFRKVSWIVFPKNI